MKRRNFVLGLGSLGVVSGGATLSAASLADSATTGADFRVVAERELTVSPGESVRNYDTDDDITQVTDLATDQTWSDLEGEDLPTLWVEGTYASGEDDTDALPTNDELQYALGLPNDDGDADKSWGPTYKVDNRGLDDEEVAIRYDFGADIDQTNYDGITGIDNTNDAIALVARTFELVSEGGTTVYSPNETDYTTDINDVVGGSFTISAGEEEDIRLRTNVESGDTGALSDLAGVGDDGVFGGTAGTADLLDQIVFGVEGGE